MRLVGPAGGPVPATGVKLVDALVNPNVSQPHPPPVNARLLSRAGSQEAGMGLVEVVVSAAIILLLRPDFRRTATSVPKTYREVRSERR